MARGDQLERQWSIIQTLISSHMGKSAADLAKDLECNPRTVYRDLEALQVAGFPMYTERVEGENLWSLLEWRMRNGGVAGYGVHVAGIAEFAQLNTGRN